MYLVRLFILVSFCIPTIVGAQFSSEITGQTIAITLSPQYPAPGEQVTATIDDYSLGIISSDIQWFYNGVVVANATNERSVVFSAGTVGTTDTITVNLKDGRGLSLTASAQVTPLYTDLIIEPQTFTPQFYQGRALPTAGSFVRATALISNTAGLIDPATHVYTWRLEGKVIGGGGKKGGQQIVYEVPLGRDHVIGLDVANAQGQIITRRSIAVRTAEVDARLYEVSPLYGLSFRSMTGSIPFISNTLTLKAIPYNLDLRANAANVLREWRINNQLSNQNATDPYEITLERNGLGLATVQFKLHHREALLQKDEVAVQLQF